MQRANLCFGGLGLRLPQLKVGQLVDGPAAVQQKHGTSRSGPKDLLIGRSSLPTRGRSTHRRNTEYAYTPRDESSHPFWPPLLHYSCSDSPIPIRQEPLGSSLAHVALSAGCLIRCHAHDRGPYKVWLRS